MPLKVLFDHQAFSMQQLGGVSRYFFEIMSRCLDDSGIEIRLPIVYSRNHYLNHAENRLRRRRLFGDWDFRGKKRLEKHLLAWNRRGNNRAVAGGDYDLLHPTYYDPYFLDLIGKRSYVITVYDMIHELYQDRYPGLERQTLENKRRTITGATRVIAISENTKADLIRLLQIPAEKIEVTHLGNSLVPVDGPRPTAFPPRYLLFVGERQNYKNFNRFAAAVAPLLREAADLHLICTGHAWRETDLALFERLQITRKVELVNATDAGLAQLYRHAELFVFPSLYEGFGIPVLEAFACSCPAALSRRSSLPEVAGEAAAYFDPENTEEIGATIRRLLADADERRHLVERGRRRLDEFSWDRCAKATKAVYRKAIGGV